MRSFIHTCRRLGLTCPLLLRIEELDAHHSSKCSSMRLFLLYTQCEPIVITVCMYMNTPRSIYDNLFRRRSAKPHVDHAAPTSSSSIGADDHEQRLQGHVGVRHARRFEKIDNRTAPRPNKADTRTPRKWKNNGNPTKLTRGLRARATLTPELSATPSGVPATCQVSSMLNYRTIAFLLLSSHLGQSRGSCLLANIFAGASL